MRNLHVTDATNGANVMSVTPLDLLIKTGGRGALLRLDGVNGMLMAFVAETAVTGVGVPLASMFAGRGAAPIPSCPVVGKPRGDLQWHRRRHRTRWAGVPLAADARAPVATIPFGSTVGAAWRLVIAVVLLPLVTSPGLMANAAIPLTAVYLALLRSRKRVGLCNAPDASRVTSPRPITTMRFVSEAASARYASAEDTPDWWDPCLSPGSGRHVLAAMRTVKFAVVAQWIKSTIAMEIIARLVKTFADSAGMLARVAAAAPRAGTHDRNMQTTIGAVMNTCCNTSMGRMAKRRRELELE